MPARKNKGRSNRGSTSSHRGTASRNRGPKGRSGSSRRSGSGRSPGSARGTDRKTSRSQRTWHRGGIGGEQVEGRQAVRELLLAGRRRTRTVMIATGLDRAPIIDDIVELANEQRVKVTHLGRSEFESKARSAAPQGVIAYADPLPTTELLDLIKVSSASTARSTDSPFLLIIDGITDPGNLGGVLRTAECAGVTGVVMRSHRAARITPSAAKAASGAIEHLKIAEVPGLPTALRTLSEHHVWTVGLDAAGQTPIHDLGLSEEAIALVLGAEGKGLSRLVAQRCDVLVSIPLHGVLNSLNVSAAAAVACYQISRDRGYLRDGQVGPRAANASAGRPAITPPTPR